MKNGKIDLNFRKCGFESGSFQCKKLLGAYLGAQISAFKFKCLNLFTHGLHKIIE